MVFTADRHCSPGRHLIVDEIQWAPMRRILLESAVLINPFAGHLGSQIGSPNQIKGAQKTKLAGKLNDHEFGCIYLLWLAIGTLLFQISRSYHSKAKQVQVTLVWISWIG